MAPVRPYWKGYLKLSLVSCPIALYTGTSSTERVSFRQINKKTGNRLRQQLVDEVTREPVDNVDKGRGYARARPTRPPHQTARLPTDVANLFFAIPVRGERWCGPDPPARAIG